jgi:hypothetical protein
MEVSCDGGTDWLEAQPPAAPLRSIHGVLTEDRQPRWENKIECGLGQPPKPHLTWIPALPFVTARRRNDRLSPTAPTLSLSAECRICQSQLCFAGHATAPHNCCGGQRPCLFSQTSEGGGRNARATSSRSRTVLGCPSVTHPCGSPAAASSAAIIRPVQECSRFAEPTLRQVVAGRNTKNCFACEETVEDETSLWRYEEN